MRPKFWMLQDTGGLGGTCIVMFLIWLSGILKRILNTWGYNVRLALRMWWQGHLLYIYFELCCSTFHVPPAICLSWKQAKKNSVLQSDNGKNMLESFATFNCSVTSCKRQDVSNRGHKTHCCIDPHHQLQWCQRASISLYNVLHPAGPSDISPLPQLFPC